MSARRHIVRLTAVSKFLPGSGGSGPEPTRLDLRVYEGELLVITGAARSGKSLLLNLMGGLEAADAGAVEVAGAALDRMNEIERADWRTRNVGYVFQFFNLIPVLSALNNVMLPLSLSADSRAGRERRAREALALVGLEGRELLRPSELSSLDQRRVAIARAIVAAPRLLLCDEPAGGLDETEAHLLIELLGSLHARLGCTLVMVTRGDAAGLNADRVINLDGATAARHAFRPRPRIVAPRSFRLADAAMPAAG